MFAFMLAAFTIASAPYTFVFPRDHASHPSYRTEWWYCTGHLRSNDGRSFGYELTFFRIGLRPGDPAPAQTESKWRGHELLAAHFAITDESGAQFFHEERLVREALGQGAAATDDLMVRAGDWTLIGAADSHRAGERMTLHAAASFGSQPASIDFVQLPRKPPAIHGRGGVSRKGACASCASHYYSYTRLATSGSMLYKGKRMRVTGETWMDHEFGSGELAPDQTGWDWYSVQLDDGRELMLYVLRQKDGSITPQSSGSLISRDGAVSFLPLLAFSAQPTGAWLSPHTQARYPSGWRVRVPSAHVDLTLTPTVLDQELADPGGVSYWEGSVRVRDAISGRALGLGYVELTGYAGPVTL